MPIIFNPAPFVAAGVALRMQREREEKRRQQQREAERRQKEAQRNAISRCLRCSHFDQETADDVACCNCCDELNDFFDPIR